MIFRSKFEFVLFSSSRSLLWKFAKCIILFTKFLHLWNALSAYKFIVSMLLDFKAFKSFQNPKNLTKIYCCCVSMASFKFIPNLNFYLLFLRYTFAICTPLERVYKQTMQHPLLVYHPHHCHLNLLHVWRRKMYWFRRTQWLPHILL